MKKFDYDCIVIGGGGAGLTAAKFARGVGKKVALIEKTDHLGGECTWTGCIPSKTLIHTAHVAHDVKNLEGVGLRANNAISFDTQNVMAHMQSVINDIYATHTPDVLRKDGVDVLFGEPQFVDAHTIILNDKKVYANKFIITTGTSPFVPPIDGIDSVDYLTNETIFKLKELPKSLLILGGGAIGSELSSALNRLGVQVQVIEMQERILMHEDAELVERVTKQFKQEGVHLLTGMRATKIEQNGNQVTVTYIDNNNKEQQVTADKLLVAVGRRPNIDSLQLENAGVQTNKRGIVVDNYLRTTTKNIFACGDVVGPYLFSHMAWYQAVIAARNAFIPFFKKKVDYNNVVWCTFTAPELATLGLTEEKARAKYGDSIKIYRHEYKHIDRGHTDNALNGLLKVICDKKGYIVGGGIVGERAGELLHELQLAKVKGIKFINIESVIHAYPTFSDLIWYSARKAYAQELENNWFVKFAKKFL